jgi:predicted adenylyl cyclase CyaB
VYGILTRMPSNVEIKARLSDRAAAEAIAGSLCDSGPQVIHQEDVFFQVEGARLKLRIFDADRGELIRYERADVADARVSKYSIARTSDPRILLEILGRTLGEIGTVRKKRTLYLAGQTRIHLDEVEGLGDFLELEVVMRPRQTAAEGKAIAEELLAKFEITPGQLLGEAYVDLLQRKTQSMPK